MSDVFRYSLPQGMIVAIHMRTWEGFVPGALHYYSDLNLNREGYHDQPLFRLLSGEEMVAENKQRLHADRPLLLAEDAQTSQMHTREQVMEAAKAAWREYAPEAKALLMGSLVYIEPHLVVDATFSEERVGELNDIHARYQQYLEQGHECDEPYSIRLTNEWYALMQATMPSG